MSGMQMRDFFISYTQSDQAWAEWIAWQLEAAGYSTVIQSWDFSPGSDFVSAIHEASQRTRSTLAVLSLEYLNSGFTQAEWAAAFCQDPKGHKRVLIPVRVRPCEPDGLLATRVYVDLVGQDKQTAKSRLLAAVKHDRKKPPSPPPFPGMQTPPFPAIEEEEEVHAEAAQGRTGYLVTTETQTCNVELRIEREFQSYSEEEQDRLLSAIKDLLHLPGIVVVDKRPGSTLLRLALPADKAESLVWLARQGALAEHGVTDATLTQGDSPRRTRSLSTSGCDLRLRTARGEEVPSKLKNLSLAGIACETDRSFEEMERVEVVLTFGGSFSDDEASDSVSVTGAVVRSQPLRRGDEMRTHEVAIYFTELKEPARRSLAVWIGRKMNDA